MKDFITKVWSKYWQMPVAPKVAIAWITAIIVALAVIVPWFVVFLLFVAGTVASIIAIMHYFMMRG